MWRQGTARRAHRHRRRLQVACGRAAYGRHSSTRPSTGCVITVPQAGETCRPQRRTSTGDWMDPGSSCSHTATGVVCDLSPVPPTCLRGVVMRSETPLRVRIRIHCRRYSLLLCHKAGISTLSRSYLPASVTHYVESNLCCRRSIPAPIICLACF